MEDKINIKNTLGDFILPKKWVPIKTGGHAAGIYGDVGHISIGKILSNFIIEKALQYLKKDSIVLDIGAHMGIISVGLGRHLGTLGGGKIIAIEASPENFEYTEYNIKTNVPKNVNIRAINAACHNENKNKIEFPSVYNDANKLTGQYGIRNVKKNEKYFLVDCITVDSLNLKSLDIIKIDTEGNDINVLLGATRTIKQFRPIIFFENNSAGVHFQLFKDFFAPLNYDIKNVHNNFEFMCIPN